MRKLRLPSWIFPALLLAFGMAGLLLSRPGKMSVTVKPVAERQTAPSLSLRTLQGEPWKLSDYAGRVVVINYFGSWCPPCRLEAPDLVSLHEKFAAQGVEFVMVSVGEEGEAVASFVREFNVVFPVAQRPAPPALPGTPTLPLPTTVLVDKTGRIAATIAGRVDKAQLQAAITSLLAE